MFRTILLHINNDQNSDDRTRVALGLAHQFDATLVGLTAAIPTLPVEMYASGFGSEVPVDLYKVNREHIEAEFGKIEEKFGKATTGSGIETSWRAEFELPSLAVSRAAVSADLVIIGPDEGGQVGNLGSTNAGDVILRTGRPVLVVPRNAGPIRLEPSVLVAWKETPEAQRAIADALPFMKRAARVVLVQVQSGSEPDADLSGPAGFLTRHGIAVKTQNIRANGNSIADALLDFASRTQTDLIVAGAYGHSRVREWVFGGMTQGLLTRSSLPCLLSR